MGKLYVTGLIFLIMVGIFHEITSLRRNQLKEEELPYNVKLSWYFFAIGTLFFYSKLFGTNLKQYTMTNAPIIDIALRFDNLIFFTLWISGFLAFVLCLKKGFYRY